MNGILSAAVAALIAQAVYVTNMEIGLMKKI